MRNNLIKVKIKKLHPDAIIPSYAYEGDAGMDLTAVSKEETEKYVEYDTGLSFEIPDGYVGLVFPRSSVSKTDLSLANSIGVIDSHYRGPLKLRFRRQAIYEKATLAGMEKGDSLFICANGFNVPSVKIPHTYNIGDRVGQIIILPYPKIEFEEVEELSETVRGEGGFGSTGA